MGRWIFFAGTIDDRDCDGEICSNSVAGTGEERGIVIAELMRPIVCFASVVTELLMHSVARLLLARRRERVSFRSPSDRGLGDRKEFEISLT